MGCLPLPLLFLLGFGIGYLVDGPAGAMWGAGIGFALGACAMGWLIKVMRGKR